MVRLSRRVHCIGIGGAGMAPLAELLASRGCSVTGSDRERSRQTERLESLGLHVQVGHEPRLIEGVDMVVYSSAIRSDNAERRYAAEHGIPQFRRAEVLGDLMRSTFSVGVAGTHGKTTTTAMVGHILAVAGRQPTVLVGGEVADLGSNAVVGSDSLLVAECDEYDRSFLAMYPTVAVVTNIEEDHLDCYRDLEDIRQAFMQFVARAPFYGAAVLCADSPAVRGIGVSVRGQVITCGTDSNADFRAQAESSGSGTATVTVHAAGALLGAYDLPLPGMHNVRNSVLAAVAAMQAGATFEDVKRALPTFRGVKRRMEIVGRVSGVAVMDDYAHHPSEVKATLDGLRTMRFGRVITVFQPHLFSRTRDFLPGFVESLSASDILVVLDIYPAREDPIPGVSSTAIVDGVKARGHTAAFHAATGSAAVDMVAPLVREGDVVVMMGAGDIGKSAQQLLQRMRSGSSSGR